MAEKTWTATGIKMGTLRLKQDEWLGDILAIQGYSYIDSNGDIIEDLPKKTISLTIDFSMLSTDMQNAITMLFNYVYQKALIEEDLTP